MRGIDLSHWNGQSGLDILRDDGVELDFCIAKHSEGETMHDSTFKGYLEAAKERGIMFGGYYFYTGNVYECFDTIITRIDDMLMCNGFDYYPFIDWERDIDSRNATFIFDTIDAIANKLGIKVGLYASYSTLRRIGLVDGSKESVATCCETRGIPIWCARYKVKDYKQQIMWGNNSVAESLLQKDIGGVGVNIHQITSKCIYRGMPISLDYNVAFKG